MQKDVQPPGYVTFPAGSSFSGAQIVVHTNPVSQSPSAVHALGGSTGCFSPLMSLVPDPFCEATPTVLAPVAIELSQATIAGTANATNKDTISTLTPPVFFIIPPVFPGIFTAPFQPMNILCLPVY
ncbi:MAG: hypothetical protein WC889_17335 [Myxococcota bacterium]